MDAFSTSFVEIWKNLQAFLIVLEHAACELFLNCLLLIGAVFSYLLTKFARQCELEIPCILCSRLDHILGDEKSGFYCHLLCNNHRSEISSLFSCCIHGNLADGNSMCEECLLSFTRKSKLNPDMDRLFMGKFGFDLSAYSCQNALMRREFVPGSMGVQLCSCCNKPWKSRQNANKLPLAKPPRSGMTLPKIPLPRRLNHHEGLKKMRERFSGSATPGYLGKFGFGPLSPVGYKELKITSDSESEIPFSDDGEGCSITRRMKEPKEVPPVTLTNIFHFDANMGCDRGQQANQQNYPSALPELISMDDFPALSHGIESTGKSERKFHVSQNNNPSVLSELMSLVDAPSLFSVVKGPLESSQWKSDGPGTNSIANRHEEFLKSVTATAGGGVKVDQVANEVASINPIYMNQSEVLKSTISSIENEESAKEPERLKGDTELFVSKNPSAQGVDSISDKGIPVAHQGHGDELQSIDPSNSNGAQTVQETTSMECGLESNDGSSISEIDGEGENVVGRLKKQIENDRKCISALYKELEEERNASAIAANQAMAMITRLQEEKASLHMEALQYLRMMEEQAEYDVEALEKANDLLAEKEKDIQDMEAEIEYFRLQLSDEPVAETVSDRSHDLKGKSTTLDNSSSTRCAEDVVNVVSSSNDQDNPIDAKSSWTELEDEKFFISQCLKDLERKFRRFAGQDSDSEETVDRGVNKEESLEKANTSILGNGSTSIHPVSGKQNEETDLVNLENEIADLNERLEALENDGNLLEHTVNSLQTGKEGLKFVQEIAHQLQELRKIVMRDRSQFAP
ncbi:probable myosin-binding protein 4 isoform X1 [Ricinus communis]|uniref:probable myosin-binding protein 4 isoform X1 n=2 Tax=Ricinus communis TaxID=3988 RepID=UPI00201A9A3F|nr:probable myosin-binding protein 4 isoform X1 [Ricinus communis]